MALIDRSGRNIPFFIEEFIYVSIAAANFSPVDTYATEDIGHWIDNGFLVRPNADGNFYGITWRQYRNNNKSLTGLTPQLYLGVANQWIECPFVKVYASNDATYPSTATAINAAPVV